MNSNKPTGFGVETVHYKTYNWLAPVLLVVTAIVLTVFAITTGVSGSIFS